MSEVPKVPEHHSKPKDTEFKKKKSLRSRSLREVISRFFIAGVAILAPLKALFDTEDKKSDLNAALNAQEVVEVGLEEFSDSIEGLQPFTEGLDSLSSEADTLLGVHETITLYERDISSLSDGGLRMLVIGLASPEIPLSGLRRLRWSDELSAEAHTTIESLLVIVDSIDEDYAQNADYGRNGVTTYIEDRANIESQLAKLDLESLIDEYQTILTTEEAEFRAKYDSFISQFPEFNAIENTLRESQASFRIIETSIDYTVSSDLASLMPALESIISSWFRISPPESTAELGELARWLRQTAFDIEDYDKSLRQGTENSYALTLSRFDQAIADLESKLNSEARINTNLIISIIGALIFYLTQYRKQILVLRRMSASGSRARERLLQLFVKTGKGLRKLGKLRRKTTSMASKTSQQEPTIQNSNAKALGDLLSSTSSHRLRDDDQYQEIVSLLTEEEQKKLGLR